MANEKVVLHTNLGDIEVEFFADKAPKHVEAFLKLVRDGFYDGIRFHRVIPGFMIQGGDPNTKDVSKKSSWGTGGPGYSLPAEFNDMKHERGVLSAARSSSPNSAGSQFFLMVKYSPHLDNQYSAFGRVTTGMDVVDKIVALPRDSRDCPLPANEAIIVSAEVIEG
ncbi:peptidylprolyl isomerase [bacterium]|nr:MAG: peptidylprolyl isomerase [bacterium]